MLANYDIADIKAMMKTSSSNSAVDVVAGLNDDYLDSTISQALEAVLMTSGVDAKKTALVKVLTEYKALAILWAVTGQSGIGDFKAKDLEISISSDNPWQDLYETTLADFGIGNSGWGLQIG